jgi:hypothetical protein
MFVAHPRVGNCYTCFPVRVVNNTLAECTDNSRRRTSLPHQARRHGRLAARGCDARAMVGAPCRRYWYTFGIGSRQGIFNRQQSEVVDKRGLRISGTSRGRAVLAKCGQSAKAVVVYLEPGRRGRGRVVSLAALHCFPFCPALGAAALRQWLPASCRQAAALIGWSGDAFPCAQHASAPPKAGQGYGELSFFSFLQQPVEITEVKTNLRFRAAVFAQVSH